MANAYESGLPGRGGIALRQARRPAWMVQRLPRCSAKDEGGPARPPEPEREASPAEDARPLRVVVVEDEVLIMMELEDLLAANGLEVVGTAVDAHEALQLAARERPDFLTMDVNLPRGMDGIEAARQILERYEIRCVFVSAYTDPETVARAERTKPLGWLAKPLTARKLQEALAGVRAKLGDA